MENNEKNFFGFEFGKLKLSMGGTFLKENGKILTIGVTICGVILISGATFTSAYAVTKNAPLATKLAKGVLDVAPKLI